MTDQYQKSGWLRVVMSLSHLWYMIVVQVQVQMEWLYTEQQKKRHLSKYLENLTRKASYILW